MSGHPLSRQSIFLMAGRVEGGGGLERATSSIGQMKVHWVISGDVPTNA
jgi:hypothetical protein